MSDRSGAGTPGAEGRRVDRRLGRILLAIIAVATFILAAPPLLQLWLEQGQCPSEVSAHGFVPKGRWEISRADCGGGRIVHQLRIVPPKGGGMVVYEAEGGPRPLSWSQDGAVGKLELERPLEGESAPIIEMALDKKGQPEAAILVREGRRRAHP